MKSFDERIEAVYMESVYGYTCSPLREEIRAFPPEYRALVGARATFIKQRLLYEKKIGVQHIKNSCGLCMVHPSSCDQCPAEQHCPKIDSLSPYRRMMITHKIYMAEHEKFV